MATYLILNLFVLAVVMCGAVVGRNKLARRPVLVGLVALVALTLVFDNLIILAKIVAYDPAKISGLHIGVAPIEDFAYSLAASLLLPLIWKCTKGKA